MAINSIEHWPGLFFFLWKGFPASTWGRYRKTAMDGTITGDWYDPEANSR
jgi:hypothetical protein